MRAFVLEDFGQRLKQSEVPRPKPGRGEALVRMKACGVGLTLSWVRLGRMNATAPRIIGHEIAGVVEEIGEGVTELAVGDSVAVYFYLTCGKCEFCLTDRETTCVNFRGNVGTKIDGGFAEYVKLPVQNLFKFDSKKISYAKAAIISDAIATPLHIAKRRARLTPLDRALIFGAGGGVGIHMVQMARLFGAEVIGVDISAEKVDLAKKYGAIQAINAKEEKVAEAAKKLTRGRGVDCVIDFVSSPSSVTSSYESLSPQGRLVLVGHFHPEDPLHLADPQSIIRKEISIMGSRYASKQEFREAIDLVEKGKIEPVVTSQYAFDEIDKALLDVEEGRVPGRAVITLD
ncbi:MAG: zinc-binding dehydrogenase [Nitrososphaerota archaeon]|nr:zinc-binding dehydrogenase [Nitrososphaerota archaeon]